MSKIAGKPSQIDKAQLAVTEDEGSPSLPLLSAYLTGTLLLPAYLIGSLFNPRWRAGFAQRIWQQAKEFPKGREATIWFHGASVGEVSGIVPVVKSGCFRSQSIIVTTTSLSGKEQVRKSLPGTPVGLMPIDHPLLTSWLVKRLQPKVVVSFETEIWPAFLASVHQSQVPLVVVNGRISDYSWKMYRRIRRVLMPFLRPINFAFVQTDEDGERFAELGVRPKCITVSGSTKYDHNERRLSEPERQATMAQFGLDPEVPCFVAGSVRPEEDRQIVASYLAAREKVPGLQMIIAPRHQERFAATRELLSSFGLSYNCRSQGTPELRQPVLLLDTFGELGRAYAVATLSFVGATLVDIGGHNPFEPACAARPIVVGPYTKKIKSEIKQLLAMRGAFQVGTEAELIQVMVRLLNSQEETSAAGNRAFAVWQKNRGATALVTEYLLGVIEGKRS